MDDPVPDGRPLWTLFFDGTLFKRYQDYLQSHDLTKILNNRASAVSSNSLPSEPPILNDETNWLPPLGSKAMENNGATPISRMTSTNSDNFLRNVEKKRRNRRTIGCVVLGILCLGAIAAAVALIIHFVFVKSKEHVSNSAPIHIPGSDTHHQNLSGLVNESRRLGITTISPRHSVNIPKLENIPTITEGDGRPQFIPLKPIESATDDPKLAQSIEMKDMYTTIGSSGIFSCSLRGISEWTSVFIRGKRKSQPPGIFEYILTFSGEFSLKGNNSDMVVSHKKQKNIKDVSLDDVLVYIAYTDVICGNQDTFTCGVQAGGETESRTAKVIITVDPAPEVNMEIPVQVIEGELLRISASWMAGYPDPHGNLSWSTYLPGEDTPTDFFTDAKTTWTLKRYEEKCETVIDTFTKFEPKLESNGTDVIVKPEITPVAGGEVPDLKITSSRETLYVVPEIHCDGFTNDTRIAHPYTCTKFVRCMPDKMLIYPCPEQTCFQENSKQCN
ncbi:uncharacterized protein LOC110465345 [Mizuhopecten yessoensis]|uniref:Chitin-binding type-2 domain-containing protein n=1 Tax=Mizuhopecten yessoensis TaxID=6573 RepID=A0A210PRU9_MIZYE|nr:uncharacterized protein LOC110465345 [Mizuhopecten yessoensis]OWF39223.1 hypothetical protein KP79_PYT20318 [Mizuhopecten yessoensis]